MNERERQSSRHLYEEHLAEMSEGAPLRLASMRVLGDIATVDEVLAVAKWELSEALFSLPPSAPDTRPADSEHASCCVMRAKAMLRQLERLLTKVRP